MLLHFVVGYDLFFLVDEAKGLYIDVSSGATTHEKKNRHKRAAKEAISPPVMKKQKTGACVEEIYNKFILHKRKLKSRKKDDAPYVSSSPLLPHLFLYCTSDKQCIAFLFYFVAGNLSCKLVAFMCRT